MQITKWSYQVIQDILNEPNVIAVKWPARLDRAYRVFFRKDSPPDLYGAGINQIIDITAESYTDFDDLYLIKANGAEELFRKVKWR